MTEQDPKSSSSLTDDSKDRRGFGAKLLAVVFGSMAGLTPVAAGMAVLLDPIFRKKPPGNFVRITSLDAVPADGTPQRFPVIKDQTDSFNRFPETPVGMVYLRRVSDEVVAYQAICPHLGCMVDFVGEENHFSCPCHASFFEVTGERINPEQCPAPRSLDTLDVKLKQGEVWVNFKKFRTGNPKKVAK